MLRLQSVIMILSLPFKKKERKEKGIVRSRLSSFSTTLCLSISHSFSLTPSLSFTPSSAHILCEKVSPQQINCIVTCHFKGTEAQHADA